MGNPSSHWERARVRENPAGTPDAPITWVFEPERFAPLAKLTATNRYGVVTDHLGTPTAMLDEQGQTTWSADIGVYGELRNGVGEKGACPFRWPGQYEDAETGLYYNRFRYYDPEAGEYVSQDPIGLRGGLAPYAYVADSLAWRDPFGLNELCGTTKAAKTRIGYHATSPEAAAAIRKSGFRPGTKPGRLGSHGTYLSNTPEGAIAEFTHHNPGVTPEVLTVQYRPGAEAVSDVVPRNYVVEHPINADSITAPSVRAPGTLNTNVLNGSVEVVK